MIEVLYKPNVAAASWAQVTQEVLVSEQTTFKLVLFYIRLALKGEIDFKDEFTVEQVEDGLVLRSGWCWNYLFKVKMHDRKELLQVVE